MKSDSKKGKVAIDKSVSVEELPDTTEELVKTDEIEKTVLPKKKSKKQKVTKVENDAVAEDESIITPETVLEDSSDEVTEDINRTEEQPNTEIEKTQSENFLTKPIEIHKLTKRENKILLSIFFAIGLIWLFSSVFLSKTMVGTTKISSISSKQQLAKTFDNQAQDYQLSISYPNGKTKKYKLDSIGITLNTDASVRSTQKQQRNILKRLMWWKPIPAQYEFKEKPNALRDFITREVDVSVQPSKDATLTIENGEIKLSDSVSGIRYSMTDPEKVIGAAIRSLNTDTLKLQKLTEDPALSVELLKPYKDSLEKTLKQSISFVIGDKTVTPTPAQIATWLDINPNAKEKKLDITVNSGKVVEYINKIAYSAIRPARSEVIVKKADGSEQVIVNGVRGLDVVNKSDVATTISKTLLENKGINVSLPVSYQPYKTISTGFYEKWIEADITNKRLYAHEFTETVNTILISAGAPATPTVTGQYAIGAKYASQDMRGNNVDGSTYFQPRVPWVSYFYGGYAIHGNYWRPLSYFGNINSSHGCIGMTTANAEWIYNWAPKGTPVIIYR